MFLGFWLAILFEKLYLHAIKVLTSITEINLNQYFMRLQENLKNLSQISVVMKSTKKGNAKPLNFIYIIPKRPLPCAGYPSEWSKKFLKIKFSFSFLLKKRFCFNLSQKSCIKASRFKVGSSFSFLNLGLIENMFWKEEEMSFYWVFYFIRF